MKASQTFLATLKEAPADAEIVSHQLMVRAGLIRLRGVRAGPAGVASALPEPAWRRPEAHLRREPRRRERRDDARSQHDGRVRSGRRALCR